MSELYGYTGKILKVDLTSGDIGEIPTANYLPDWVGGRGIGAKIHWEMVGPEVKAFDPENVLSFMTGAATGIIDTRVIVQAVSPLGYPVESYYRSTMGSHFGAELKHAGWDGVVLVGKADGLKYLLIEDDSVRICDASDLHLMDVYATQQNLQTRYTKNHRIALIGPAGENLVRDACIQAGDHNACGLGGLGAVMGSKNLKAIVVRGTQDSPQIYNLQETLALRKTEADIMVPNPGVGAAAGSEIELAGQTGEARVGMAGCFGCNQPCGYSVRWGDGSMVSMASLKCGEFISCSAELAETGEYVGRNHYKRITQQGLLGLTGQPSYRMVIQDDINNIYDEPITLLHNHVITEADLGIPYTYGTPEFTNAFNTKLAYREGDAMNALAEGQAKFVYEYLGTPEAIRDYELNGMRAGIHGFCPGFCITIYRSNGLLSRITSTVNAGDQRGLYHYLLPMYKPFQDKAEEYGRSFANWEFTYAPKAVKFMQDFKSSMDLVDRCFFNLGADTMGPNLRLFQHLHTSITGQPYGEAEEQEACDRLWLLERAIEARQGHTRADDSFFDSVYEEYECYGVTPDVVNSALDEYYDMRGIDHATGLPKKSEFARLGITEISEELETVYGITLPE